MVSRYREILSVLPMLQDTKNMRQYLLVSSNRFKSRVLATYMKQAPKRSASFQDSDRSPTVRTPLPNLRDTLKTHQQV